MVRPRTSPETTPILQLLSDYSFDVDTCAEAMVTGWLQQFEPVWVSQAITEALYQGRYKMVSVDHILQLWQRRGQPLRHFNREFESIILGQSWGQFLAATKANAAANRDSEPSSSLSIAEATTEADPDHHSRYPFQAIEAQGNGRSVPIPPFGVHLSLPDHGSACHPFPLAAADSFSTNETQPEPPEDSPTLFGASSRTIPPLTPDQLARLTQPALAPEVVENLEPAPPKRPSSIAENLEPAPLQSSPPLSEDSEPTLLQSSPLIDDSAAEALMAGFFADEFLLPENALTTAAAETSEADEVMASSLSPDQNLSAAESTKFATPSDAGSTDAMVAATDLTEADLTEVDLTEDDTTDLIAATKDTTEGLAPASEPVMANPETAQVVIPNFQPVADRVFSPESADSIPPFVPNPGPSEFHQRLKAVVEAGRQEN